MNEQEVFEKFERDENIKISSTFELGKSDEPISSEKLV